MNNTEREVLSEKRTQTSDILPSGNALALMQRATLCVEAAALSDRTDAVIGQLALLIIQVARTSPSDQAENAAQIAKVMAA